MHRIAAVVLPLALFVVLVARNGATQERTRVFTFHSIPPGARVFLHSGARDAVRGAPIGVCEQPVTMMLDEHVRQLNLTFELPGHLPRHELCNIPADGGAVDLPTVVLDPASTWVAVADEVKGHLLLAGGAGVVAAVLGAILVTRRRKAAGRERRAATLAEIIVPSVGDPHVGRTLGELLLVQRIGAGGMAVVYRAIPEATLDLRQTRAVKIIRAESASDDEFRNRFRREINALRALSHPNVVRLYDWGEQEGLVYLVMEHVAGETLRGRVRSGGLGVSDAFGLLREVGRGLTAAHALGLVHRDLKPENVMVTASGAVKVMDFGLARPQDPVGDPTVEAFSPLHDKRSAIMGTPGYMAPEQIVNEPLDGRADQYALALLAYELLSGRLPTDGQDTLAVLRAHVSETPLAPLRQFRADAPPALDAALLRATSRRPDERFASVEAFIEALEQAIRRD